MSCKYRTYPHFDRLQEAHIKSDNPPNVVVTGAAGTWKTYLIEALGKSATQMEISVSYWRFPPLLEKTTEAFNWNESSVLRRKINSKRLFIIDDFAMAPLNDWMRTDLLSLIDDCLNASATIIAAQLPQRDEPQVDQPEPQVILVP